jgi:hypothetical protein
MEHPKVLVRLNSGDYEGRINGKVSANVQGDRSAMYEIELLNHPTLKKVTVKRNQIIRQIEDTNECN